MAGAPASTTTASTAAPKAARKNDWHLYKGKKIKIGGVAMSSVWIEISREKRLLSRPGQKFISGEQKHI
jgi:hypothetical protein